MNKLMPKTVTTREIQKDYKSIFSYVKETNEPAIVLIKNTPDVAIMSIKQLEYFRNIASKIELIESLDSLKVYKKEKALKKLKRLNSLKELF